MNKHFVPQRPTVCEKWIHHNYDKQDGGGDNSDDDDYNSGHIYTYYELNQSSAESTRFSPEVFHTTSK